MKQDKLLEKANTLPLRPGCYLMKNLHGEIIYVGKAKSLKARVSSYFNNSAKNLKTTVLVGYIEDFDFVIVATEAEALVLENNLIKKYAPKYNIRLKDDKSYPYIIIDLQHPFPRVEYSRRWEKKAEQLVFGPYTTGTNIKDVLKVLRKNLQLRDCANSQYAKRKHPCLLYQMKQCHAPCVGLISAESYQHDLQLAIKFLQGKPQPILDELNRRMMEAAEGELFELAAQLRDDLSLLKTFTQQSVQKHAEDLQGERNLDVVGIAIQDDELDLSLFMVRHGILLGSKNFHFVKEEYQTVEEQVISYLLQYYTKTSETLPERIVLPLDKEFRQIFKDAMQLVFSQASLSLSGAQGTFSSLSKLEMEQASETQRVRLEQQLSERLGLIQLQKILGLQTPPEVIECYDIAVWNGKSPTASQIVFHQGIADKKKYRYYHLQERPEGNNDFAMMREVLERRIKHGDLPDLLMVDGGIGQVNIFVAVLKELGLSIPVIGIAKERSESDFQKMAVKKSDERLIIPGQLNPIALKKYRALMMILVQMRDEAHRFSRKLHHHQEKKRIFKNKKNN